MRLSDVTMHMAWAAAIAGLPLRTLLPKLLLLLMAVMMPLRRANGLSAPHLHFPEQHRACACAQAPAFTHTRGGCGSPSTTQPRARHVRCEMPYPPPLLSATVLRRRTLLPLNHVVDQPYTAYFNVSCDATN